MTRLHTSLFGLLSAAVIASGCFIKSADDDDGGLSQTGGSGGSGGTSQTGGSGGTGGITDPPCDNDADIDGDVDGWTTAQGDCNDCQKLINPGAFDYNGNEIDEDCNGADDDTLMVCDADLALDSTDPLDGARAMELCTMQQGEHWGVVSAEYLNVDGTAPSALDFDKGHGILPGFGEVVTAKGGSKIFAISSGAARQPGDTDFEDPAGFSKGYSSGAAPGFPKESPACPGVTTGQPHDSVMLRVQIKTPTNALSFHYNVNMYTWEYPNYICTQFNDFITAIMIPAPSANADATCDGLPCGNITFDAQDNPLSVNAGFLEVCEAGTHGGKIFDCSLGVGALAGTGFEQHASTSWLQTKAPVESPGDVITLEFGVWDSGDGVLDTTGLIDNFEWDLEETIVVTDPQP